MGDAEGLTLAGLRSRLRQIGVQLTDTDPEAQLWIGTSREGHPILMGNPTHMTPMERLALFEAVRERVDPFGARH